MHDRRLALLTAALGFALLPAHRYQPEVAMLRRWLDTWPGIGAIAVGMGRQGYDLQLTRYAEQGWRANFYTTGIAHSVVSGSGWAATPWRAVQDGLEGVGERQGDGVTLLEELEEFVTSIVRMGLLSLMLGRRRQTATCSRSPLRPGPPRV